MTPPLASNRWAMSRTLVSGICSKIWRAAPLTSRIRRSLSINNTPSAASFKSSNARSAGGLAVSIGGITSDGFARSVPRPRFALVSGSPSIRSHPMSAPPVLTELKLSDEMKKAVNTAFERKKPIVISYIENGAPKLSFRGSTQAYSDTALAIWVRMPDGPILDGVKKNPAVALIYGDFRTDGRDFMIFRGKARIDKSEPARKRVFEAAHVYEQGQDKDRKGNAMIIELDSVEGFFGGALLKMKR